MAARRRSGVGTEGGGGGGTAAVVAAAAAEWGVCYLIIYKEVWLWMLPASSPTWLCFVCELGWWWFGRVFHVCRPLLLGLTNGT